MRLAHAFFIAGAVLVGLSFYLDANFYMWAGLAALMVGSLLSPERKEGSSRWSFFDLW
jgi:hypothetical protein